MLRLITLCLALFTFPLYAAEPSLLIFGDSLSDEGRVYELTDQTLPPYPYYQGRFTNGPVWTEYMEGSRQNYAVGGATSSYANILSDEYPETANTGLQAQVDEFLASNYDPTELANTIVYINIGGNDFLALLDGSSAELERLIPKVVDNIIVAAQRLRAAGAGEIVLFGLPNLAEIPKSQGYSVNQKKLVGFISWKFNQKLLTRAALNRFTYIDIMAFMKELRDPSFGFNPDFFSQACLDEVNQVMCDNPDEYFFWDAVHPTTRVYEILAAELGQ